MIEPKTNLYAELWTDKWVNELIEKIAECKRDGIKDRDIIDILGDFLFDEGVKAEHCAEIADSLFYRYDEAACKRLAEWEEQAAADWDAKRSAIIADENKFIKENY